MTQEFSGKTFIVTGASSGIGRAVCVDLAARGASVILWARNEDRLEETLSLMAAGRHKTVAQDLTRLDEIAPLVKGLFAEYETIDGLVYCAGIGGRLVLLNQLSYDTLHNDMLISYYAYVEMLRALVRAAKKRPLRIVGISSISTSSNDRGVASYAAAKSSMETASRAFSTELIAKNATVNMIRPAFVDTPMMDNYKNLMENFTEEIVQNGSQPLGIIPPDEVADMAAYLLGDTARHITGMSFTINAGARG